MKILVVKLSSLGDIVHTLPVVDIFVHNLPGVRIHWLVELRFADLLRLHPFIDRVISVDTRGWRKRFRPQMLKEISSVIKTLRREHYDLVVDFQGNSKSGFFTLFSGGIARFGWSFDDVREWPNVLATNRKIRFLPGVTSIRERLIMAALEICRSLAGDRAGSPDFLYRNALSPLRPPEAFIERQKRRLKSLGIPPEALIVGLQPGTTWETKRWSLEGWKTLIELLVHHHEAQSRDIRIVVFWGNDEEFSVACYLKNATPDKVLLWRGGGLIDLASGIYLVDVMIGPDTGPVHLAALLGVPTVSIYRATGARRNAPPSDNVTKHIALQSPMPCSPCLKKSCPENSFCETSVSPYLVFRCTLDLLTHGTTTGNVPGTNGRGCRGWK
ncbi:glycosyltransferase family 9 protein [Thermodesulforhabdus norvegica]|uniref:Heptosyltransferase-1 n=1 Tax=Thermodesulforhabdus norvegica TaxID=39841 RepID=A0A1I4TZF3_9BACT|nr:glycosyltransferase family 9 protein [Thermodesulforhabdus norvegica]SFM82144.1 heptosyltransferase-1 [Thermodesulforhabdus norvegica]